MSGQHKICSLPMRMSLIHLPSTTLRCKTFSFFEWKFNNLIPDIISLILSYFSYYEEVHFKRKFAPLDETIQHLRLSCKHWNQMIETDSTCQLQEYYLYNRHLYHLYYTFPTQKMPSSLHPLPTKCSDKSLILKQHLPNLIHNSRIIKSVYCKQMERQRVKKNIAFWLESEEYNRWMILATAVFCCLSLFFILLGVQDVFTFIFGALFFETFIRYFYNIIFIPLYCILIFFLITVLVINVSGCMYSSSCFEVVKFVAACLLCSAIASAIFFIQLNVGVLPLYKTPSLFGRNAMIPWPIVFIPWYMLLFSLSVLFFVCAFLTAKANANRKYCSKRALYICSVMLFSFLESVLSLVLVIWIGIALEFPSIIDSTYLFIPAYVMECLLLVFTFWNVYMEMKQYSSLHWKEFGWQRTLCLIGVVLGLVLNHILCSLAWYHIIPLFVAYLEILLPISCFYVWTMLSLYPQRTKLYSLKTCMEIWRDYNQDFTDGSWVNNLMQQGYDYDIR